MFSFDFLLRIISRYSVSFVNGGSGCLSASLCFVVITYQFTSTRPRGTFFFLCVTRAFSLLSVYVCIMNGLLMRQKLVVMFLDVYSNALKSFLILLSLPTDNRRVCCASLQEPARSNLWSPRASSFSQRKLRILLINACYSPQSATKNYSRASQIIFIAQWVKFRF